MPHTTLRILAHVTLALTLLASDAEAGVGVTSGGALSSLAHTSPVQMVQSGMCWEQDGPDGPGYYPCGEGGPNILPAFRRHHRHDVVVAHPPPANPIYPAAPAPRLDARGPSPGLRGAGAPAVGAAGVHAWPGLRGAAPVSPGLAGVNSSGAAAGVHVAAPASPGPAGVGAIPAGGAAAAPHIGAPVSPGLAGVHGVGGGGGAFHGGGIGHR
jgi:hypothetical protein